VLLGIRASLPPKEREAEENEEEEKEAAAAATEAAEHGAEEPEAPIPPPDALDPEKMRTLTTKPAKGLDAERAPKRPGWLLKLRKPSRKVLMRTRRSRRRTQICVPPKHRRYSVCSMAR
jgi:hypothetical protein